MSPRHRRRAASWAAWIALSLVASLWIALSLVASLWTSSARLTSSWTSCVWAGEPAAAESPRRVLGLDGIWDFATDPDRVGEAEGWFLPGTPLPRMPREGYAPSANGKIRVPGVWDNQGYGTETEKVRHNFVGLGWYRRDVTIPAEWESGPHAGEASGSGGRITVGTRRIFLRITGVHRAAKVWLDGRLLGEHVGYLSPFELDVTSLVRPGRRATVAIQVDSRQRWDVDTLFGASDLADYMDVAWGGIQGHVSIEARAPVWLEALFIEPRVGASSVGASNSRASSVTASATLRAAAVPAAVPPRGELPAAGRREGALPEAGLSQDSLPDAALLEILDEAGRRVAASTVPGGPDWSPGCTIRVSASLPDAELWSPEAPVLYSARLSLLRAGRAVDRLESRFGMREIRIDGPRILLNGKPIFLRGYGDDHIYPEEMAQPSDKSLHLRRLRTIKSYGFNHVRHHSTILLPEYYDACDEVGILATAEFPIVYAPFLPGGERWKRSVPPGTDPELAAETYRREWAAAIAARRNHPSILAWVMGNELWDGVPLRHDFARIARSLDPTRPFADSDGVTEMWGRILDPERDRDTLDIHFLMYDVGTNPLDNPGKFRAPDPARPPRKPIVSHETGNYVTFSRPDLVEEFRHNIKPFWLAPGRAKLAALGLLAEADLWASRSERLYILCHKRNIEALRKNPWISGYHWWLFQDYWTSSNGLVDHYFRPKAIPAEEVRRINAAAVFLEDGLDLTYRGTGRLETRLLVSSFASGPIEGAELHWRVEMRGESLAYDRLPLGTVVEGRVVPVADVGLDLPDVPAPEGLVLRARLSASSDGAHTVENEWTARLYPASIGLSNTELPVFADGASLARRPALGLRPIPEAGDRPLGAGDFAAGSGELPAEAVYLATLLDTRLLEAVERGARVVLLDETRGVLPSRRITYRTSWWKAGDHPGANHTGTVVYDHPATRAMAPEGWCDAGWFHLLEGASKYVLEGAPARPRVIVRALPSLALVEDAALLFEVGIGKGSLIVSGLHHDRARGRPEEEWLVARLIEHAAGAPQPPASWASSSLRAAEPPPPGPHLTGFTRVVRNEGEEGTWHSWREDDVKFHISRQTRPGNLLEWETVPAPERGADRVTFVFAGGLGYASEPATEGFVFLLAGKEALRFDLPPSGDGGPAPGGRTSESSLDSRSQWKSPDGTVLLRFLPRRHLPQDALGLLYVTVDRRLLEPGKPLRLGVRSVGTGSRRWFGLNEYAEGVAEWPAPDDRRPDDRRVDAASPRADAGSAPESDDGASGFRALRGAERVIALRGGGFFPVMVALGEAAREDTAREDTAREDTAREDRADGRVALGAVLRGGAGHLGRGGRLDFIRSEDGGRTWSAPVVAADSEWDDRNPALGRMPDGTIVLAYAEARSYRPDGTFDLAAGPYLPRLVTSSDGGKTWSAPQPFDAPFPNPSPYGRIVVLRDGTAILFVYRMPSDGAAILRSTDSGNTWGDPSPLPGHDETQVVELRDGRLLAFTRIEEKGEHGLLLSESADGGRTWGGSRRLLKAQLWPFDATELRSGSLLLCYGSRLDRFGAGVLLSRDAGRSWDEDRRVLIGWDSLGVDTGYPSTVELPDGTIATMYYAAGTKASPEVQAIVVRYREGDIIRAMGAMGAMGSPGPGG